MITIFRPYLNYLNHVNKLVNTRSVVQTFHTNTVENYREKLDQ